MLFSFVVRRAIDFIIRRAIALNIFFLRLFSSFLRLFWRLPTEPNALVVSQFVSFIVEDIGSSFLRSQDGSATPPLSNLRMIPVE